VTGRIILTAEEMRAAEARAIAAGTPVEALMDRAGNAAAEAIRRFAGPVPALVLCGPGNNGGDGYVVARVLREQGVDVRVAALAEPATPAARAAGRAWGGDVSTLAEVAPASLLIDALFGTGRRACGSWRGRPGFAPRSTCRAGSRATTAACCRRCRTSTSPSPSRR
jgi:hydroxyethylthiazole kinase-like uncharacterized protein yjeF